MQVTSGSVFAVCDSVFGMSRTPGTVAQVVSPFVAVMEIRQKDLTDALQRHFDRKAKPFGKLLRPKSSLQQLVATTEIFSKVTWNFVKALCQHARLRSRLAFEREITKNGRGYLPGQTLCIQAKQETWPVGLKHFRRKDKGQMFLVRGGTLVVVGTLRKEFMSFACKGSQCARPIGIGRSFTKSFDA